MQNSRRDFIKKSLTVGAIGAVASVGALAKSSDQLSGGVSVGKSKKKEILYKKNANWEAYFKASE